MPPRHTFLKQEHGEKYTYKNIFIYLIIYATI